MFLIIIGFIVFLVGQAFKKRDINLQRLANPVRLAGLLIALTGVLTSCIVQIEAGEIGVKKLFGKVQNEVLPSGLHFINPLLEVQKMDIRTENYTMSGIIDEGHKAGDDAIRVLTSDGLEVTIDLTVLYKLNAYEAPKL